MTTTNPLARLSPSPVKVAIGSSTFTIPPRSAARWIDAIVQVQMELSVLPRLLDREGAAKLMDLLMTDQITEQQLSFATYRAIGDAAGRDWWQAVRLVGAAADEMGRLLGELQLRGVDAHRITLAAWCSAVYALLTHNLDEKNLFKFNASLMLAPDIEGFDIEDKPADADQVLRMLRSMPGVSIGG